MWITSYAFAPYQPVEGRLDKANGETLYFFDGEVEDSEWYSQEGREVTEEELEIARMEAEQGWACFLARVPHVWGEVRCPLCRRHDLHGQQDMTG